jgi:ABC-type Fe3+-hydroxamate transport system, periplasmic component
MSVPILALLLLITGATESEQPYYLGNVGPRTNMQRVVSLAPSITEMLFALNVGDRVVGVTRFDDFPAEVKKLPIVGGYIDPSVEAIVALHPDLVVCVPNPGGRDRMEVLSRLGIPVLVMPERHLQDIFGNIRFLGKLLNKTSMAETLITAIKQRLQQVEVAVKGLEAPRALLVYGHKPLIAAGQGSFGDEMLHLAGGKNIVGNAVMLYPNLPMEEVIRLAPEVVIDASMSGSGAEISAPESTEFWNTWRVLPAVKNHHVYIFDSALWFRPGPRIAEGIEHLARLLHPKTTNQKTE